MKQENQANKIWDVAVIGGGPAGMMAAGRAAELGASVILIEKNESLGVKLLITGGGRCNVTNAELDVRKFLEKYKDSDKFLFSAFSQFSVNDTLDFFNSRNMSTKIEAEGRVFPTSNSSQSVHDVLTEYMKKGKVEILTNATVTGFTTKGKEISAVHIKNGKLGITEIRAKKFILATGGTSRPETGSTGEGFNWLSKLGHTVVPSDPALVPIKIDKIKSPWFTKLQGASLQNIKITTFQNDTKQESKKGKILFTHFGVSGPTILNMSKDIGELIKYGDVIISLDLPPSLDHSMLNTKLQELFHTEAKKKIKNSLSKIIPSALVEATIELSGIDPDIQNSRVSRDNRLALIKTIKNLPMHVAGLLSKDKAVVSSGGVVLTEIDFKNMSSRIISNLYLVGDVLNIDRPSGGYSLQLCWTTGHVAGTKAAGDKTIAG